LFYRFFGGFPFGVRGILTGIRIQTYISCIRRMILYGITGCP